MPSKTFKTIFPYIVILILVFMVIHNGKKETKVIEIPAKEGEFEVLKPVPVIQYDTIYKDSIVVKENPVNQELLTLYNQAKDSLEQLQLYKEAITVRNYKEVFTDQNTEITVLSTVTGTLESQRINYRILPQTIDLKNPNEGVYIGLATSISTTTFHIPAVEAGLNYVRNKKIYGLGINNHGHVNIGISQKIF